MHKKAVVAGLLAPLVVAAEVVEAAKRSVSGLPAKASARNADRHRPESAKAFDSSSNDMLNANPHTHLDLEPEVYATAEAPFSASGSQRNSDSFQLIITPRSPGVSLVGQPFGNFRAIAASGPLSSLLQPEFEAEPPQRMYAHFASVDELIHLLASATNLQPGHLAAIRRTALEGTLQVIGGHYGAMRLFDRQNLEALGITYRPLD